MIRDSALGAFLSFAIIALVAVVFYRPDPATGLSQSSAAIEPTARIPPKTKTLPPPSPTLVETARETPRRRTARVSLTAHESRADNEISPPRQSPKAVPPNPRSSSPRGANAAFTRVQPGESLADVAWRVYGDESTVKTLRSANRDQLPSSGGEAVAGMLLRTP